MIGKFLNADKAFNDAKKTHKDESEKLDKKLSDKAKKYNTSMKYNYAFKGINYNIIRLKKDLDKVTKDSYIQLSSEHMKRHPDLPKEEYKDYIPESAPFNLKYSTIVSEAKELIERKIHTSDPIQDLLKDSYLAEWVKTGRKYHEDKREKCAFCGSEHSTEHWQELWGKLDKHFNQASKELEEAIDDILASIKDEKEQVPNFFKIKNSDFYSKFTKDLYELGKKLSDHSKTYCTSLESIKKQVEKRKKDIFTPFSFDEPVFAEEDLNVVIDSFEEIRKESNKYTKLLSDDRSEARYDLRLHEVFKFANKIKYVDLRKNIKTQEEAKDKCKESQDAAKKAVEDTKKEISGMEDQLMDESKGADLVNYYLRNAFGRQSLSLKAIEEKPGDKSSGYRFEVIRNEVKAFNLSGGECNLIAFCYFIAKLKDANTKDKQLIIWIDDPVSSLDANHIFFIYSLIEAEIVTPKKYEDGEKTKERDRFKQLFVSTHNLIFLRYLKHISYSHKGNKSQHFFVTRDNRSSDIVLMPEYLKKYDTEFNFLFHKIYKCAEAKECDRKHDCYYNFGNNARKFLEVFLYYEYQNAERQDVKMALFFGDALAKSITARIINERSHGAF